MSTPSAGKMRHMKVSQSLPGAVSVPMGTKSAIDAAFRRMQSEGRIGGSRYNGKPCRLPKAGK